LGQDAYWGTSDQLDSHIIWYKILKLGGYTFADSYLPIPELMGAPRLSLYNEFYLGYWLHYLLGTFPALVTSKIIIHFTAFVSMFYLLQKWKLHPTAQFLGSLYFALLPFSLFWGISVAAQPFVFFVFLQLEQRQTKPWMWVGLLLYTLYSNFYSVSIFLYGLSFLYFVRKNGLLSSQNLPIYLTMASLSLLALGMEYRLLESVFFNQGYTSHRVERVPQTTSMLGTLKTWATFLLIGDTSVRTFFFLFIPPVLLFTATQPKLAIQYLTRRQLPFGIAAILILLSYLLNVLSQSENLQLLRVYNTQRIYTLFPLLSAGLLTGVLSHFIILQGQRPILKGYLFISFLGVIMLTPFYRSWLPASSPISIKENITYRQFFSEDLFQDIKSHLGPPSQYRIACLGFHPAIAQYNGFYTLDGYLTNYPLTYKHEFRTLIAAELEQNQEIKDYFDGWGSRCYLMDDQLGKNYAITKNQNQTIPSFDLNCDQFIRMGGQYLLSSVEIAQFSCSRQVHLVSTFENDTWKIFLYQIQ